MGSYDPIGLHGVWALSPLNSIPVSSATRALSRCSSALSPSVATDILFHLCFYHDLPQLLEFAEFLLQIPYLLDELVGFLLLISFESGDF